MTNRAYVSHRRVALCALWTCLAWLVCFAQARAQVTAGPTQESAPSAPAAPAPSEPAPASPSEPPPGAPAAQPVVPAASAVAASAREPVASTTQDAALLSPPPAPTTNAASASGTRLPPGSPAVPPPTRAAELDDAQAKAARDPMGELGLSLKFGFASAAASEINNPTYNRRLAEYAATAPPEILAASGLVGGTCGFIDPKCRTEARKGFQLALALHMGGDGFGWDAEPYLTVGGNALAVGVYTGPKFDIHIASPFYLGFGFGGRVAYVKADGWRHGADFFGRIPVHAIYYVTPGFALTIEGSFGAGASLFVSESKAITDPRTGKRLASTPKVGIGVARSWDLTLGFRFP